MNLRLEKRQIDYYDKLTDKLVGEIEIIDFQIEIIQKRFSIPIDDPYVYNPYLITITNADLFPYVIFDFYSYDYFLACYSS